MPQNYSWSMMRPPSRTPRTLAQHIAMQLMIALAIVFLYLFRKYDWL